MDVSLEEFFKSDDEVFDHFASVAEELISELKKSNYPQSLVINWIDGDNQLTQIGSFRFGRRIYTIMLLNYVDRQLNTF